MSKSSLYLPAPAFGLTWFESGKDSLAYVLMPGGGGSSKTGVKNQIMLASMNPGAALEEQVKLLDGHLTDTEKESNFCSGISYGMMFETPVVCALISNRCVVYAIAVGENGSPSFETKFEVQGPSNGEESDLNCSLITESGLLVCGGDLATVHIWEVLAEDKAGGEWQGESLFDLKGHSKAITALSEHPFSSWICSASKDGSCKIWDTLRGQLMLDIPALVDGIGHNPKMALECKGCCFSEDGCGLYSIQCTRKGPTYLICWELHTKHIEDSSLQDEDSSGTPLATHSTDSTGATQSPPTASSPKNKTRLHLASSVRATKHISKFAASKLVLSSDGHYLGIGVADGHVIVLRVQGLSQIADVACHDFPVTGLGFAPARIAEAQGLEVVVATCSADRAFNVIRISQKSWTLRLLQLIFVLFLIITVWALYMATKGLVQNTV